jgi:hypothetical protein
MGSTNHLATSLDVVLSLSESCAPGRVVLAAGPDDVRLATMIAHDLHADGVRCAVVLYGVRDVPLSLQMLAPVMMTGPADLPPGPSDQRDCSAAPVCGDAVVSRALRWRSTSAPTLPITNVSTRRLVSIRPTEWAAIDEWDDSTTVDAAPLSLHEQEAIAALYRYRTMRSLKRAITRRAWKGMQRRLADARMQLTVGLTAREALDVSLVRELLDAEGWSEFECCGRLSPATRCCAAMVEMAR